MPSGSMGYANGTRYNHRKQKAKRVWRREDEEAKGAGDDLPSSSGAGDAAEAGANPRASSLSASAKPFKRKLSAAAAPFAPLGGKLEDLERKKKELQEKIQAKKRKLAEDDVFRKKQEALREAAKHSQDVAERKAKIARLQGGFDKVKAHMNQTSSGAGAASAPGKAGQSNLKPTSKLKEVTREDVIRVLHAMNDYDVLQVNLASGSSEIRKNFLKLSRAFHPDKCRVEGSKEAFQRVSKAYNQLKKQHS